MVLRGFEHADELEEERRRALLSATPFNARQMAKELKMRTYAPFPFLPPVTAISHGNAYEFRDYRLKPGGLPVTLAGWEQAIKRARAYTAHLVIAMYALDGPTRITHIWAFSSLEERASLRADAYARDVWPPKGGPENIIKATSTIGIPESYSPLR
jgi:hypothetical protein